MTPGLVLFTTRHTAESTRLANRDTYPPPIIALCLLFPHLQATHPQTLASFLMTWFPGMTQVTLPCCSSFCPSKDMGDRTGPATQVWPEQSGAVTAGDRLTSVCAHTLYGCLVTCLLMSWCSVQNEPCSSFPPLQVPEIIQYICHNMNSITETTAQGTIKKILYLLAQTYTNEVILTLFEMEDQSQR